jgi:alpha-tubulin suppressor-like RCC1 family protein
MENIVNLPPEQLIPILLNSDIESVLAFCSVNQRLASICKDEYIWERKYKKDYGSLRVYPGLSWRENYIVKSMARPYSAGNNNLGQLGVGPQTQNTNTPVQVKGIDIPCIDISAGSLHSLFLTNKREVYASGFNKSGQLGLPNVMRINIPRKVPKLPPIIAVSAGGYHSLVLDIKGNVYAFGRNEYGQLGLGHRGDTHIPTKIKYMMHEVMTRRLPIPKIKAISAGEHHSLLLDIEGNVYVVDSSYRRGLGLTNDNDIPIKIEGIPKIKAIAAGYNFSLLLTMRRDVYAFGRNEHGQLGLGHRNYTNTPTKIQKISRIHDINAGNTRSLFVDIEGNVYISGNLTGLPITESNYTPTKLMGLPPIVAVSGGFNFFLLLSSKGEIYLLNSNNSVGKVNISSPAVAISAGESHYLLLVYTPESRDVDINMLTVERGKGYTLPELKKIARKLNIKVSGKKAELVQRIRDVL